MFGLILADEDQESAERTVIGTTREQCNEKRGGSITYLPNSLSFSKVILS